MAVSRDEFAKGMTYAEYKAQMTRNKDRFEENEGLIEVGPEDLAALRRLPKPLNVLALAEDWCGDVIANLPVLGKLAEASSGKLDVRILLRDQNLDVMDRYLNRGEFRSIPTFVFLDQDFGEVGVFKERPESVTKKNAEKRAALHAAHPEWGPPGTPPNEMPEDVRQSYQEAMAQMRDEVRPFAIKEVLGELRAIVEKAAG
ncbi:MAG TPA: thioredoxin family protein [Chloroflexota bacterium]|jgi:hypothetical protein